MSMLNKDVVFLRSERAWKRWIQSLGGCSHRDYGRSDTRPPLVITAEPPADYPCWAYRRVVSFGYEEEAPEYLYRADLVQMLDAIDTGKQKR